MEGRIIGCCWRERAPRRGLAPSAWSANRKPDIHPARRKAILSRETRRFRGRWHPRARSAIVRFACVKCRNDDLSSPTPFRTLRWAIPRHPHDLEPSVLSFDAAGEWQDVTAVTVLPNVMFPRRNNVRTGDRGQRNADSYGFFPKGLATVLKGACQENPVLPFYGNAVSCLSIGARSRYGRSRDEHLPR
jgi:hypothetical protein